MFMCVCVCVCVSAFGDKNANMILLNLSCFHVALYQEIPLAQTPTELGHDTKVKGVVSLVALAPIRREPLMVEIDTMPTAKPEAVLIKPG